MLQLYAAITTDSAQSRIPRLDSVSSRIPVPGSFRIPSSAARLPPKRGVALQPQPPATPLSFLRPPSHVRSGAVSIARSYSGDKLSSNGEPSPFPLLAASTPAPVQLRLGLGAPKTGGGLPFLKKLEQVASGTTERLEDIKLCRREFAIPSDDDDDEEEEEEEDEYGRVECGPDVTVQMLVDESLELVGANSTDNLLDPPATELPVCDEQAPVVVVGKSAPTFVRSEHTVTLQRDGNVTYEIRRSGTFVKSSRESLNMSTDRPRPPVMSLTCTRSHISLPNGRTFRRESMESIDSPILDTTRTLPFRRPSTGELLLEEDGLRRPPILNSTMVHERLLNVTQSIPNITQELLYADAGHEPCPAPGDSVLNRTHSVDEQKRALGAGDTPKSNRLTFNLEETLNLIRFSSVGVGEESKHDQTQVFSSTIHSDSMAIPASTGAGMQQLAGSQHGGNATMLLMDISAQDRTLVPPDLERDGGASDDEEQRAHHRRSASVEADVSAGKEIFDLSLDEPEPSEQDDDQHGQSQQQLQQQQHLPQVVMRRHLDSRSNTVPAPKQRFSFGLDLTECTLDCSIELCDSSLSLTKPAHLKSPTSSLTKQGSFEMDESLGILTPDQMKEFLDSTTTNTTNNTNNAASAAGLELQLNVGGGGGCSGTGGIAHHHHHKHGALQHHCRIDQTPSPEELPLDPVGVKTDMSDIMLPAELLLMAGGGSGVGGASVGAVQAYGSGTGVSGAASGGGGGAAGGGASELSQADSDPKTDQMTKSATSSKVSNSFITSITSITSLDTGYQGDGEMSRPASRGADHSPSNGPRVKSAGGGAWQPMMAAAVAAVPRRQDPMTDSDFFTESDADDVFNRGDARRAQIIDGQLYENRADDDLVQRRADDQQQAEAAAGGRHGYDETHQQQATDDMSPDVSTDTMSSSNSQNFVRAPPDQHTRDDEPSATVCKLTLNERELDVGTKANLSTHIGASPMAGVEHHYQVAPLTTTLTMLAKSDGGDIGVNGDNSAASAVRLFKDSRESGASEDGHAVGDCDQENKRPSARGGVGSARGAAPPPAGSSNLSFVKKSNTPNKWDAVMSKIAENKSVMRRNFSDVKSRISCGSVGGVGGSIGAGASRGVTTALLRRDSPATGGTGPGSLKSPPSECTSVTSRSSAHGKRTISGSVKRGRTHSKDSQQSSLSDLSLSGGSPKLTLKVSSTRK
uniref:Uncharacterized protein n=1 Tax=Anopheles farauti TaxID=69004 RepID=A0A182QBH2_9DIPT